MATIGIQSQPPLVVIVGPTASGKTGLAIRIAREFGGEIISADSRAIYKGLDIGTAKPSCREQQGVPHWGIDLAEPGERYTAANFQHYAMQKIAEIRARGHIPILVGGTGLYVDAVLYNFEFPNGANDTTKRDELMQNSLEELHAYCRKNNISLPENSKNKRYVVNNILRDNVTLKRSYEPVDNTIVVGIATDRVELRSRIVYRADDIITPEVIEEAKNAAQKYGWDTEAMTGNVYPLVRKYVDGEITFDELKNQFITSDWRLAKRQLTWLKRSEHTKWLDLERAYTYIAHTLEKTIDL